LACTLETPDSEHFIGKISGLFTGKSLHRYYAFWNLVVSEKDDYKARSRTDFRGQAFGFGFHNSGDPTGTKMPDA
jgi:hypothetical protein